MSFEKVLKMFWACIMLLSGTYALGQISITGEISDFKDGEKLKGVAIYIENTSQGTTTNEEGYFSLSITSTGPQEMVISFLGYSSQKILIEKDTVINIALKAGLDLDPLIIIESPIETGMPAPFMKITPRSLQRDNDLSIASALNRVPGVYIHSGALNTNRITMRGIGNRSPFSTTKIRAYLDEIPLTSGDGETAIEDIDLSILREAKIWKGPTASIYGAGLGGMIHLQTTKDRSSSFVGTRLSLGSFGMWRSVSELSLRNSKNNASLDLNYNKTHSEGYRKNNEYDRQGFSLLGQWTINENNETTLLGNFTKQKAFIPSSLNREDYLNTPRKAAFTWQQVKGFEDYDKLLAGVSHKLVFGKIGEMVFQNKTSIFTNFRNNYESRPFNILSEKSRAFGARYSFELLSSNRKNSPFPLLSIGGELFKENYDWQTFITNGGEQGALLSDNKEERKYSNHFVQTYSKISEHWSLLAGVNFNRTRYLYEDQFVEDGIDLSGEYTFEWIASPRLGLTYQFNYNLSTFLSISHGFSPPSFSETLTPDGTINPEIQPEKGWNYEIGSRGKLFSRLTYELSLYQMLVRDLLVAQRIGPDQYSGFNAGKTKHLGLELFLEYEILSKPHYLSAFTTWHFSDYDFVDFVNNDQDFSGKQLTGTAPHHLNMGLDLALEKGWFAHLNFQYLDAMPMRDDNSIFSEAYQLWNFKGGYRKKLGKHFDLKGHIGIQNIFNEKYASMILINAGSFGGNAPRYYYPGQPTNIYGGISLKYIW